MYEKFKAFLADDTLYTIVLILLVGVISFGLGRASVSKNSELQPENQAFKEGFQALLPLASQTESKEMGEIKHEIRVVASKSGTKYHLPDCPGAMQMKTENKIEFSSIREAEAAGYTPAANCPGL